MQDVQRKYNALTETAERGLQESLNFVARERSLELETALLRPAIARDHRLADNPEFQGLLSQAVDAVKGLRIAADEFTPDAIWEARARISYSCQHCHDRFRR